MTTIAIDLIHDDSRGFYLFIKFPRKIVLRSAEIYSFLFILFRLIGRHQFGQLTPFDLVRLLIVSESISPVSTNNDQSLITGLISAGTLIATIHDVLRQVQE